MADNYNSQWTGAQIDEAISDVRTKKDTWDGKLDKSGGTMTGGIDIAQGNGNGINVGDRGRIGRRKDSQFETFLGLSDDGDLLLSHGNVKTLIRGSQERPSYNGKDMSLAEDIATHNTDPTAHNDIRQAVSSAASAASAAQQTANAAQNAANNKAPGTHASQHASGGSDPITPASIGAAKTFENVCQVLYGGPDDDVWLDDYNIGIYQDVDCYGILSTDTPIIDVQLSGSWWDWEAYLAAWACVQRIVSYDGYLRICVGETPPEVAFNIIVRVVR